VPIDVSLLLTPLEKLFGEIVEMEEREITSFPHNVSAWALSGPSPPPPPPLGLPGGSLLCADMCVCVGVTWPPRA
jgi:hypothetical protein